MSVLQSRFQTLSALVASSSYDTPDDNTLSSQDCFNNVLQLIGCIDALQVSTDELEHPSSPSSSSSSTTSASATRPKPATTYPCPYDYLRNTYTQLLVEKMAAVIPLAGGDTREADGWMRKTQGCTYGVDHLMKSSVFLSLRAENAAAAREVRVFQALSAE